MTVMPNYDEGRKEHTYVHTSLILELIQEHPQGMTLWDIAATCDVHYTTASRKVRGLVERGAVYVSHTIRTGDRGQPAKVYKAWVTMP